MNLVNLKVKEVTFLPVKTPASCSLNLLSKIMFLIPNLSEIIVAVSDALTISDE
jgi:hypothetical protein